jgi:hypothetical protein
MKSPAKAKTQAGISKKANNADFDKTTTEQRQKI